MFQRRSVVAATLALLGISASPVSALDSSFHYKVGYDTGGDTLVTVTFVGGDTENIKANRGLFFGGGISLVNDTNDIETEISLSYKFDDITGSNGDITWSRLPIDGLVFYRLPSVRLGGGITYHLNPDLDGSGVAGGLNVEFKNALGFIAQADWRISDKLNLGLRYTFLDYETENTGVKVDSNGLGLVLSGSL